MALCSHFLEIFSCFARNSLVFYFESRLKPSKSASNITDKK